jgi:Raf kinase inhibitor-like YbhB/YbcL family protein
MKQVLVIVLVLLAVSLALVPGRSPAEAAMTLASAAFPNGGRIPDQYTLVDQTGKNISIPLTWSAPAGTQSFALAMVDYAPTAGNWVHWLVINIPAGVTSLAAGAAAHMPAGAVQLNNSWGEALYWGPYPPVGSGNHPYVVTVYALEVATLDLPVATTLAAFEAALAGKVLDSASITGYFRIGESSAVTNLNLLR